ncbi:hypothetical protein BGZ83_009801 [Gryganskiella cystojenkinii]|nr:hypothetical protein BGZ83_009801 [Gryganskiella cystojenkinii]
MKSVLTIASLVTLGSLAVLSSNHHNVVDASPITNLDKRQQGSWADAWCTAFRNGCVQAAGQVCGGNNQSHFSCDVSFTGNVCTKASVDCSCTPTGGSSMSAVKLALQNTFAATNNACSSLDWTPAPPSPTPAAPTTDAALPTQQPSSTSDTAVPTTPSSSSSGAAVSSSGAAVPTSPSSPPATTSAPAPVVPSPSVKNGAPKSMMSQSAVAFTAVIALGFSCL